MSDNEQDLDRLKSSIEDQIDQKVSASFHANSKPFYLPNEVLMSWSNKPHQDVLRALEPLQNLHHTILSNKAGRDLGSGFFDLLKRREPGEKLISITVMGRVNLTLLYIVYQLFLPELESAEISGYLSKLVLPGQEPIDPRKITRKALEPDLEFFNHALGQIRPVP